MTSSKSLPCRAPGGLALVLAALNLGSLVACHPQEPVNPGQTEARDALGSSFAKASEGEQRGEGKDAVGAYLRLVEEGLGAGEDGVRAVLAGLDALVWRGTPGLARVGSSHALVFRTPGAQAEVEAKVVALHDAGKGHPLARALLAEALLDLVKFRGDTAGATRWRAASGAVTRAVVVGPLSAAALTGVSTSTALEEGPLRDSYPGVGPFAAALRPLAIEADDGALDVNDASMQPGLYAVAVDVEVPRAQRVWFAAQTTASAALVAGGRLVTTRSYALGGGPVLRLGWVDASAGKLRVVLRVGLNEDGGRVALQALGDDGAPLVTSAPAAGSAPSATAQAAGALEIPARRGPSLEINAAALLALGDARAARRMLEEEAPTPGATLLYARALGRSDDTPENRRVERMRAAYAQVVESWPEAWEGQIGSTLSTAARKGYGEGSVEALRDLAKLRAEGKPTHPLVRAFEAATAAEIGMRDVAVAAFEELKPKLAGTALLASLEERVLLRVGAEAEAWACAAPMVDRRALSCLLQRQRRGDLAGAKTELARLRELRGAPRGLLAQELSLTMAQGDPKAVAALHDAMPPGTRLLATLGLLDAPGEIRARLDRDRASARDAPGTLPSLRRLLEPDPAVALEAEGRKAVEQDRKAPAGNAATLVLIHHERYELSKDGLLRALLHDVRRVSGTTDVEQGVGGTSFSLVGRDMRRLLRRRIHKRDGRLLEPDAAAMASQGNSDLSQLEPGDYIEQIAEAWVLPDRAGHLVVDTPDLLPERTSVRHALIELRYPKDLRLTRWSHPQLGRAEERDEGDARVVQFKLDNASPRRIEEGAPRMDRDVALSFGTYTWSDVGRHLGELFSALHDEDPYVTRWARQAAGDGALGRAAIERLVVASGKTIRVPQANLLSDTSAALFAGPQGLSARHILELGQGSRSWVLYRALQALKVPSEIVVAEREPFSSDASFPARPSRFDHPLVIAHTPEGDVWIDADLPGPPLPAGRTSPELRGRVALRVSGEMLPVQGASVEDARDEVEIALKVDDKGDARGTFTVQLHGRAAQAIVDVLDRVAGSDRRDLLRAVVLGWMPWATVNDVTLTSPEGSGTLSLKAEVAVPSLAQGEGQGWMIPGFEPLHAVLPRPSATTLGAAYASRLGRQSALAIDSAVQYRVKRRVELPAGWKPLGALPSASIKHDLLEATRVTRLTGSLLEEEFALSLSSGTVASDAYERFAAQAKRVDDGFLAGVRLAR